MPFRHPDRAADLGARIEFEVRERVEEAVEYACLEALVRARRTRGLAPPRADSAEDKAAYAANVVAFLERLRRELTARLQPELRDKVRDATSGQGDEQTRLVSAQVALARLLPDYWQQFDAARARYLEEASPGYVDRDVIEPSGEPSTSAADGQSGSEGRGLLARLFGRR